MAKLKLTDEMIEKAVDGIRVGNYACTVALSLGISERSYWRWLQTGEKAKSGIYCRFWHAIKKAEAEREIFLLGIVQTAAPVSGMAVGRGTLLRGRDYVELIPFLRPRAKTALLIGVGGGLHDQVLSQYGIRVHGVEIEPAAVTLARAHFGMTMDVTVADGRAFLAHDRASYDAVVLDAFVGGDVPGHLYTREALAEIARHLNPDGLVVLHLIGPPDHPAVRAVARTLQGVFAHTAAVRSGLGDEWQHVYLFAGPGPLEIDPALMIELDRLGFTGQEFYAIDVGGAPVLTDDRPLLGLLSRDLAAEHRRQSLELRRNPPW